MKTRDSVHHHQFKTTMNHVNVHSSSVLELEFLEHEGGQESHVAPALRGLFTFTTGLV